MQKLAVILVSLALTIPCRARVQEPSPSPTPDQQSREFRLLSEKLAPESADPCEPPIRPDVDLEPIESALLERAANIAISALNSPENAQLEPAQVATTALKSLERVSAEINSSWPDEKRFHFRVLDLRPILVITLAIRAHQAFVVVGVPGAGGSAPLDGWQRVGSDRDTGGHDWTPSSIDLYALKRGPSGHPRFLARIFGFGCAGSYAVAYDAREWDPTEFGGLSQVIDQGGSFGLDDGPAGTRPSAKYPFPEIGKLRTDGARITLPFCMFSPIDTWDNPSMCAVDTYDVSGDHVKFVSRRFNRPDLLPIAKAIEHAQHRDYPAVRAYCASADVARRLIADVPTFLFAADLRVTRVSESRKGVRLGFDTSYRFEVEKRRHRWLIVAFTPE